MWGPHTQNSTTSNFDEIYIMYVNLTEEHNGLAPNSLGNHLRGLWGKGDSPISNFEKN